MTDLSKNSILQRFTTVGVIADDTYAVVTDLSKNSILQRFTTVYLLLNAVPKL